MNESTLRGSFAATQIHPFVSGMVDPRVMEVPAGLNAGVYCQIWDVNIPTVYNAGHHQRWYFIPVDSRGSHFYFIFNVGYRKFLSGIQGIPDPSNPSNAIQEVQEMFFSDLFTWQLLAHSNGSFDMVNLSTHGHLLFTGVENHNAVRTSGQTGLTNEVWGFTGEVPFLMPPSGNMVGQPVMLIPMHDQGRCVDMTAGNTAVGTPYQTWHRILNNRNQQFVLERATSDVPGSFRIRNTLSGLYLKPLDAGQDPGVPIVQEHLFTTDLSQQWNLYAGTDGADFVHIVNVWTGMAMDVSGWGRSDGTGLQQWMLHGGENQRFRIAPPSL